jgi:ribonuclease Y
MKKNAKKIEEEALKFSDDQKQRLDKIETRLDKKEDELESREEAVKLEKEKLLNAGEELKQIKERINLKEKNLDKELEKIANLNEEEAKNILIKRIEKETEEDLKSRLFKLSRDGEQKLEEKAKEIIVTAIHRMANSNITEFMSSTIEIEDEEVKGKIIGKEGRNIKAFESYCEVFVYMLSCLYVTRSAYKIDP